MRRDKVINGLREFCKRKKLKERLIIENKMLILVAAQPKLWESLIFPIPVTIFWVWFIVDEPRDMSGFLLLSGLTIYFIWTYIEIAKGVNEITMDFETDEVKIRNLDRLYKHFCKPARFSIESNNAVFKSTKQFSRLSRTFRIFVQSREGTLTLLDVNDEYASDKFRSALSILMTTKFASQ